METWDAIRARRNVRIYDDRPIADADLERILEAGRRAPSASNRQPWDFVVTTDRGQLEELATVWRGARHLPGAAPALGLTLKDPDDRGPGRLPADLCDPGRPHLRVHAGSRLSRRPAFDTHPQAQPALVRRR